MTGHLWKASIKISLNILFELQCRKKWCSLSITKKKYSYHIILRNFVRSLFLKLVLLANILPILFESSTDYKKSLESLFIFDNFYNVLLVYFSDTVFLNLYFKDFNLVKRSFKIFIFTWIHFTLIKDF